MASLGTGRPSRVIPSPSIPGALAGVRSMVRRSAAVDLQIGVVGRLAPWKGQHIFLEAFAAAFPQGQNRAIIVGSPLFGEEDYAERLLVGLTELGLDGRVEFRGFCDDVWRELASLDILVHSSVIPEPFGQVVVEGMAAGLPVVAAAAGGPQEIITQNIDGVLYPVGDVSSLAAVLRRLAVDPALRQRLGEAAQRRSRDFSTEVVGPQVMDVYSSVLANKRRSRH
jgi:glycosyltransferase involved in cell wall biosynthesis